MKAFKDAEIYIGGKIVKTGLAFNDKIAAIGGDIPQAEVLPLPEGAVVVPGFIDEHIHGAGGADAMDGNVDALATIAETVAKEGTTAFLATTMTQSSDRILGAMRAVKQYRLQNSAAGARLEGIHLEGPFISPAFKGAQPEKFIAKPDINVFNEYNEASGNAIKIVTLAPEAEGMSAFIGYLKSKGIIASIGHTSAKERDVAAALNCGASHVTHTFNAQSPIHHRDIGAAGSALLYDSLVCEIIADTIHVSVPAMKLLFKSKDRDSVILITDAMRAKGLSDGVSELGGQTVYIRGSEARLVDGTLAGSVLKMNCTVKNAVEKVGIDFGRAIDSATINPAKALGIDGETGSIDLGKRADFAVLSKDFDVLYTIRDGNIIYRA